MRNMKVVSFNQIVDILQKNDEVALINDVVLTNDVVRRRLSK